MSLGGKQEFSGLIPIPHTHLYHRGTKFLVLERRNKRNVFPSPRGEGG
jgi:hypothetical protein